MGDSGESKLRRLTRLFVPRRASVTSRRRLSKSGFNDITICFAVSACECGICLELCFEAGSAKFTFDFTDVSFQPFNLHELPKRQFINHDFSLVKSPG